MAIFKGAKNRDDTFVGGGRPDTFLFDPADLTGGDTIVGGAGRRADTLVFTKRGSVSADALAHVSGIERIELADGGMSIVVTQQLAQTGTDGLLTVVGGDGNDLIDASDVSEQSAPNGDEPIAPVTLLGGTGNDTLIGGADARLVFDGGVGRDAVNGVVGTVVYDGGDSREVLTDGGTLRLTSAARIDLTRSDDQSLGDRALVMGFYAVDASRSTEGVIITADRFQSVIGGKAADQITGATEITGGGGADELVGSATDATLFVLNEGDFVRGESILGQSGSDTLMIYGHADLFKGSVRGITTLSLASTSDGHAATATVNAAQAMGLFYLQGAGDLVVELGREHALDLRDLHDASAGGVAVTVHGTAGADEIFAVEFSGSSDTPGPRMTVEGGDGDDSIWADADAVLLNGGAGVDTLTLDHGFGQSVEINLSREDNQGVTGVGALKGFENVSLTGGTTVTAIIHGSAEANVIIGSLGHSTIFGEAGDDVLRGGGDFGAIGVLDGGAGDDILIGTSENSHNVMTGGRGSDTFRWVGRSTWSTFDSLDEITDFKSGQDHLEFAKSQYDFSGDAFDKRVIAGNTKVDITGADLVIYTGGIFDDVDDVLDYVDQTTRSNESGLFIAGVDSAHHLVLYHVLAGPFPDADDITAIVDLGVMKPTQLVLTDFSFI